MDKYLERLERLYPGSKYVLIEKYDAARFKNEPYDSSKDCKSTKTKWKTEALGYNEAQTAAEQGYRLGWIIPKGYCIVDIDNHDNPRSGELVEKFLKYWQVKYNYNYTYRGIHLLFRDPDQIIKTASKLKCGLNIEIDTRANGTGYIVLPVNDEHRRWGNWTDSVEAIPYFLKPIGFNNTKSFIGFDDGDGRNDALWRWRNVLEKSHALSKSEIEKTIRAINENFFAVPLQNTELYSTVLRELNTEEDTSNDKGVNKYSKFADELIRKRDLICSGDSIYSFNGSYYQPITNLDLEAMIYADINSNISKAGRKEIIEFVKVKTQIDDEDLNREHFKIACPNGVIDLRNGTLETANKMEFNTVAIPIEYDPDPPYSPRIDQFMKELANGDMLRMQFMYQVAGYCLVKENFMGKFFIFQGNGGTGKSTYTRLIERLCGSNNCSHVGLNKFDNDYYIASTKNKLVNIDDDLASNKILNDTGRFKSIVTGESISVRQIYEAVGKYRPFCTCIFSCNTFPRIADKSAGLFRRMVLIELNHRIEHPDTTFMEKLTEMDMRYFLFKAVEGIRQVLDTGHFAITASEAEMLRKFQRKQSPLNEWLYENHITRADLAGKNPSSMYMQFREWCSMNGFDRPISSVTFREDICNMYDAFISGSRRMDTVGSIVQTFKIPEGIELDFFPF